MHVILLAKATLGVAFHHFGVFGFATVTFLLLFYLFSARNTARLQVWLTEQWVLQEDSMERTARKFHSAADSSTTFYSYLGSHHHSPGESTSKTGWQILGLFELVPTSCATLALEGPSLLPACSMSCNDLGRDVQA